MGVKFASHHIQTGYTKEEIAHYNQEDSDYVPLQQRVVRYLNDVE